MNKLKMFYMDGNSMSYVKVPTKDRLIPLIAMFILGLLGGIYLTYTPDAEMIRVKGIKSMADTSKVHSVSMDMYHAIKKYSKQYNIPEDYAFSLAYQETRYAGPFDDNYVHSQISGAGAVGPMQVMINTGQEFYKDKLTKNKLKNNIDVNVEISMKYLRYLKDRYGDWGKAFGAYNTGRPVLNNYARKVLGKEYVWEY